MNPVKFFHIQDLTLIVFLSILVFLFSATCNLSLDKCNSTRSACQDLMESSNYTCQCKPGFFPETAKTCVPYCGNNDTCNRNTTECMDTPGAGRHFECICKDGFQVSTNDSCVLPPTPFPGSAGKGMLDNVIT